MRARSAWLSVAFSAAACSARGAAPFAFVDRAAMDRPVVDAAPLRESPAGRRLDGSSIAEATCAGDAGKSPELLATATGEIGWLAISPGAIYWVNDSSSVDVPTVQMRTLPCGAPVTLWSASGDVSFIRGLVTDGTAVYFSTNIGSTPWDGSVIRVTLASHAATTLARNPAPDTPIAIDATNAYFFTVEGSSPCSTPIVFTLSKVPLAGGTLSPIATYPSYLVWPDGGADCNALPMGLVVTGGSAYWLSDSSCTLSAPTIERVALATDAKSTFATDQLNAGYAIANDRDLFWVAMVGPGPGTWSVLMAPLGGSATPTTIVTAAKGETIQALAVDEWSVYWSEWYEGRPLDNGSIYAMPLVGGAPIALVRNIYSPRPIAVDATSLYWTELTSSGSAILRVAK